MKFDEMKYDVPFEKLGPRTERWDFNAVELFMIKQEGKRLYKKHPEYRYLQEDPWLKNDGDFYESITYAYMVDSILKKHPEHQETYKQKVQDFTKGWAIGSKEVNKRAAQAYSKYNRGFICWYREYLREQADPGCHAREKAQHQKELQDSINQHAAFARMEEERHPHVECPYCHSKNTEKISTVSRAVSISIAGAASSKLGKQWHCNNCNSNF